MYQQIIDERSESSRALAKDPAEIMDIQPIKNIFHLLKALAANVWYGFPSKRLMVIGITGTDGKTTTSSLIYHILKQNKKKVSLVSTVSAYIGSKAYDTGFHVTTPSPFMIQGFLKQAVDNGDEYFVLETTSHSLDQYRVYGTEYKIGILTNITHEHLQYHKTYENYVLAKSRLLKWSKLAIMNRDDRSYDVIRKLCKLKGKTYGLKNPADYNLDISKKTGINLAEFNKYNFLGAYAVCKELGLADTEIFSAMKTYKLPPGRMEVVYKGSFTVINDFAHTPNALHEALGALRIEYKGSKIIHVFGAAAFRDDTKRPLMGDESASHADTAIITEEDYRTEDPEQIARMIGEGFKKNSFKKEDKESYSAKPKTYTSIVNRKEAIEKAISVAGKGDIIVITGKGHEQSLCRGTKEYPWDDNRAILDTLRELKITT